MKVKPFGALRWPTVKSFRAYIAGRDLNLLRGRKLSVLKHLAGWTLLVYSAWALLRYGDGNPRPYIWSGFLAVSIMVLPTGLAFTKLWGKRVGQVIKNRRGTSSARGHTYVSDGTVDDREVVLDTLEEAIRASGAFDGLRRSTFPEGEGITVKHTFHNAFVRIPRSGRVVVTGTSAKARELAETVGLTLSVSMNPRRSNPLLRPDPVRGFPRALLGVVLVVLFVVGSITVAEAAYPAAAYNPAEKTVLVSFDLRSDLAPAETQSEIRLSRAAFLVDVLDEKSVEVRWSNTQAGVVRHAEQSLVIRRDANRQIESLRREPLTPAEQTRLAGIERDLEVAESEVAAAIAAEANETENRGSRGELATIREAVVGSTNVTTSPGPA